MASQLKVGDSVPNGITVYELQNGTIAEVLLDDLLKGKKVVIFGLPGAYTPGCSRTHLPGYVSRAEEIKNKGYDEIICIASNDPFVMQAWGQSNNALGKIRMLSDGALAFGKATGLVSAFHPSMGERISRFSAVIENGRVTQLNVEPDKGGLTCSLANALKL